MCADSSDLLPLILLPGLGADGRMFAAQAAALPSLITPDWIAPDPDESLPAYAGRMAAAVDPGGPCVVGGCSFGGMVALEMARHLDARACLLISSVRSPREFPLRVRVQRPIPFLAPRWFARLLPGLAGVVLPVASRLLRPARCSALAQLAETDGEFLRWSARALFRWQPTEGEPPFPVYQIQGGRDHVLPAKLTRPDVVVPGAGHLLPMTHPEAVNEFLRRRRAEAR